MKRVYSTLIVGLIVGTIITMLLITGMFETLELKTLDHRIHTFAERLTPSEDIVIITVDQNSIDYLKHKMGIVWKWPRDVYAITVRYLGSAGAKAILLDFDFSDPDIDRAEFESGETDLLLGEAIGDTGIVFNSVTFYDELEKSRYVEESNYDSLKKYAIVLNGGSAISIRNNSDAVIPIPPLIEHSAGLGATNTTPDIDGIIRRVSLFQEFKGNIYTYSPLSLALWLENQRIVNISGNRILRSGPFLLPLTRNGEIYLNWYGPGGPRHNTFKYFPIAQILLSHLRQQDGMEPLISPDSFRDKIVMIGSSAPSLYDLKTTPFSNERAYPGVEIVATALNNLLDGTPLRRTARHSIIVLVFFISIISALASSFARSIIKQLIIIFLLIAGVYCLSIWSFYQNVFMDIVPAEFGIAFSFLIMTVFNYFTEGKEKRWLRKAFSQYISPTVMEEITNNPEKLKLGGEKKDVTVLFSDIRGFTSISERLEPELITGILNEYFTPMSDIVLRNEGTLDKYIGDAIMAFFGAPIPVEDHARRACGAALDMIESLQVLKKMWHTAGMPSFIQNINIGVGINSGTVVVGNMGSESRFDYTIIGDNVNLGSRLEGINKLYGTNIIISANTYTLVKDEFICREIDIIKVAGKDIPIKIFELVKARDGSAEDEELLRTIALFHEGLNKYRERTWGEAIRAFTELHEKNPEERVYTVFIDRCNILKNRALPDGWDGIFERREK